MFVYHVLGTLYPGIEAGDFFCRDGGGPNVMIGTAPILQPGEMVILPPEGDGWVDAEVLTLDRTSAIRVLAEVNKVSEKEITLIELGQAISI